MELCQSQRTWSKEGKKRSILVPRGPCREHLSPTHTNPTPRPGAESYCPFFPFVGTVQRQAPLHCMVNKSCLSKNELCPHSLSDCILPNPWSLPPASESPKAWLQTLLPLPQPPQVRQALPRLPTVTELTFRREEKAEKRKCPQPQITHTLETPKAWVQAPPPTRPLRGMLGWVLTTTPSTGAAAFHTIVNQFPKRDVGMVQLSHVSAHIRRSLDIPHADAHCHCSAMLSVTPGQFMTN